VPDSLYLEQNGYDDRIIEMTDMGTSWAGKSLLRSYGDRVSRIMERA